MSEERHPISICPSSLNSLVGLLVNRVVLPHGFKDVVWNLLHGSLINMNKWGGVVNNIHSGLLNVRLSRLDCRLCATDSAATYLCHLHGNTFREIPLYVFKVYLCCAARYMRQLQNKRHLKSIQTTGRLV